MPRTLLRNIDLNLLPVLGVLLETRNVTAAAGRLNMAQPSVSRALARLRHLFNDPLLIKSAGGMIATHFAEGLVDPLAELMRGVGAIVEAPRFDPATSARVFSIATTDYGALALLPSLTRRLSETAPAIGLDICAFSANVFARLGTGEVDLVLYSDDPIPPHLRQKFLFEETYGCLVRRNHPVLRRLSMGRLKLADFVAYPHVLVNVTGGRTGVVDEKLAELGHARRVATSLPYFATAALVIAERDLFLTLPMRAVRQLAKQNPLVALPLPLELAAFQYQMVWHERSSADIGAIWFRNEIAKAIERAPERRAKV